jgi:exodeoxyribonuclease V gamma subunit
MSVQLFVSNNLKGLFLHLQMHMKMQKLSPLMPYYIVSQTEGMNIWLKYNIAEEWGIASNLKFCKPNDILYEVYILLGGRFQITLNRQSYIWMLFDILGQEEFKSRFPEQAEYLLDDKYDTDIKRLKLAEKIADLLDQYQIYRPEYIREWSIIAPEQATHWQAYLWSKIVSIQQQDESNLHNINYIRDYILEKIDDASHNQYLKQALPQIYLFGLSVFTQYHLEVFHRLSKYIDINFYLINPAPHIYWGDDKSEKDIARWKAKGYRIDDNYLLGNDLLVNWGRLIQNTLKLLFQNDEILNNYEPIHILDVSGDSLLHLIQNEIFNNVISTEDTPISASMLKDNSIQIHAHYTPQREVEGVYNFLIDQLVLQQKEISYRDILIICSDINLYAPYLEGVFNNNPYKFKYKLVDTSIINGDNLLTALLAILSLKEDHFTAKSVLDLLDYTAIRHLLNVEDVKTIRNIVVEANIRYGIKGSVDNQTYTTSWWNGLRRIMYGICMSDAPLVDDNGELFYPLDVIEGSDMYAAIRFVDFVSDLIAEFKYRNTNKPILLWLNYVEGILSKWFDVDNAQYEEEIRQFRKIVDDYKEASKFFTEPISFEVFYTNFSEHLSLETASNLFYSDGITCSSVVPMRSIPFAIVAFLGMNDGDFPRKEKPLSFDLMHQQHRLGDRNIKDSDKHLFLETFIATNNVLYLSYLGRSATDNAILNSSVLIEDLLNYIQERCEEGIDARQFLVTEHPLHTFSYKYNNEHNPKLKHYSSGKKYTLNWRLNIDIATATFDIGEKLSLRQLIKFIKSPITYYYNKILGIYLDEVDKVIPEFEPFVINAEDGLIKYKIKDDILNLWQQRGDIEAFTTATQLNGIIPLQNVGKFYITKNYLDIAQKMEAFYPQGASMQNSSIQATVEGVILEDNLVFAEGSLYDIIYSDKLEFKYIIATFLKVLLAKLVQPIDQLYILKMKAEASSNAIVSCDVSHISKNFAYNYLTKVIRYMKASSQNMIHMDLYFYKNVNINEDGSVAMKIDKDLYLNMLIKKVSDKFSILNEYLLMYYRHIGKDLNAKWCDLDFVEEIIKPILDFKSTLNAKK